MKEPERLCLNCGKEIKYGRSDKRYCDDICRARDTRKRIREETLMAYSNQHKAIINAIKRNYRILKKSLLGREEWIADLQQLYFEGFDMTLHTRSEKLKDGSICYYCFEIGWQNIDEGRLQITKNIAKLSVFNLKDLQDN